MSTILRLVRGFSAAALVLAMTVVVSPVAAASCKGASHQASLTNGAVSPGSGDTTTLFKFKVRYSDNASCVPASVTVTVSGMGDLAMEPVGGSATSYQRETKLPSGSFTYSFTATSVSSPTWPPVKLIAASPAA